jgi:hypothetical protein
MTHDFEVSWNKPTLDDSFIDSLGRNNVNAY